MITSQNKPKTATKPPYHFKTRRKGQDYGPYLYDVVVGWESWKIELKEDWLLFFFVLFFLFLLFFLLYLRLSPIGLK